jgi:hypothetical protein
MKFRVSREIAISWPEKCVWCLDIPTKKMEMEGGWIWQKKSKVEFPVCSKHYFWLKGTKIAEIVLFMIWVFRSWGMPYDLIMPGLLFVIWISSILLKPVKIRVRKDFYILEIRNDDYAREFALLNNLAPYDKF